jgi:periplasmic copper chaperone A
MRLVIAVSAMFIAMLALAAPASAHVTISAPGATRGGSDAVITFRVPTESDTASTTGLQVRLPTDTPIAGVLVQPIPGWTHTQKTVKLAKPISTDDGDITEAVAEIDWTATAGGIKPGEFGAFVVMAGQLPDAPRITFKAVQIYSDGSRTAWTEVPAPGSTAEPEHPAPSLELAAASSAPATSTAPVAKSSASSSQTGAVILGSVALAVAVASGALTIVRRRVSP